MQVVFLAKKMCHVCTCCFSRSFLRKRRRIREVLVDQGQGRKGGSGEVAGVRKWFLSVLGVVCAGMSMRGPFLSLFERDPCSSAHATRRLCQRKPRSLGVLLWSTRSTETGTAPSRQASLRAQKIRAGEVTSSSSRIRTDHGRFFLLSLLRWTSRRLERRRRPPLLRSREGNSSCHANRGSLASLKCTAHGLLGFCIASSFIEIASGVTAECCGR